MASERELKKRIQSVKNISQVTSALAAVSASKATQAQKQVEATRDYAGKAFEILNNLASQPGVGSTGHPLLTVRDDIKNAALVLITGDRGLAGAYNSNVVAQAENGMDAVEKAEIFRPDVIVMDINMPKLNGIEATRLIKNKFPFMDIVGLSVQDEKDVEDSMKKAGAVALLNKAGDPDDLVKAILACAEK